MNQKTQKIMIVPANDKKAFNSLSWQQLKNLTYEKQMSGGIILKRCSPILENVSI